MTNSFFFQNWEGDFRGDGIPFTAAEQVREVIEDQESLDAAIFRENDRDGYARAMDMHGILPPNPHTLQQLLNGTATVNPNTEETSDSSDSDTSMHDAMPVPQPQDDSEISDQQKQITEFRLDMLRLAGMITTHPSSTITLPQVLLPEAGYSSLSSEIAALKLHNTHLARVLAEMQGQPGRVAHSTSNSQKCGVRTRDALWIPLDIHTDPSIDDLVPVPDFPDRTKPEPKKKSLG